MFVRIMNVESEIKEIRKYVIEISKKLDDILYEKEITSIMKLSEKGLSDLLHNEPDIYTMDDLKVKYK